MRTPGVGVQPVIDLAAQHPAVQGQHHGGPVTEVYRVVVGQPVGLPLAQLPELPDAVEGLALQHLLLPPRRSHRGSDKVTLDVVRGERVHVVWVPGVDEDEAGDPPEGTPGPLAVLLQLAVGHHHLPLHPGLLRRQEGVVGDLVEQLAVLLLGAGADLV